MKTNILLRSKALIGVVFLVLITGVVVYAFYGPQKNQGYQPEQPLPFSHKQHAGLYKIPCMYCHVSVEKSRHATVPQMNICMNCHRLVKTESPFIQKLTEHYTEGKPVPWIKVHDMPEFVYFNHQRHIAKGVACTTCHGEVQEMDKVKQVAPMTMGWCVNCHRQPENNAPTSCDACHR